LNFLLFSRAENSWSLVIDKDFLVREEIEKKQSHQIDKNKRILNHWMCLGYNASNNTDPKVNRKHVYNRERYSQLQTCLCELENVARMDVLGGG